MGGAVQYHALSCLNTATSESSLLFTDHATISFAMIFELHLSSEELRIYSHGLSSDAKLEETEDHLLICQSCQDKLVLACQDEQRVKLAADIQRSAKRLRSIHITEDGPIFSAMRRGAAGKRIARHWGRQLSGCQICSSVQEANKYLTESFQQMFPNHVCSKQCIDRKVSDT